MCVDALLFSKWLDICLSMERNEFLFSLCLYTQLLLAFLNSHYFYPQISIFPLSCGRGDLGWLGVWLLARVIPPQSFLVPNVWPEITTALIRLCAVAVVAVNWQDSVLVMEFACFTVYLKLEASGHFWILLFSGLLITLFCCACDHVDKKKKKGHAFVLAYGPGMDCVLLLGELSWEWGITPPFLFLALVSLALLHGLLRFL